MRIWNTRLGCAACHPTTGAKDMSEKRLPREVNVNFVKDHRTGGYHNVLEICSKDDGVRYVMAQDAETAKERDKYKLRAHLQQDCIALLETRIHEASEVYAGMEGFKPRNAEAAYVLRIIDQMYAALKETCDE